MCLTQLVKTSLDPFVNAADRFRLLSSFLIPLFCILYIKLQVVTFLIDLLIFILTKISFETKSIDYTVLSAFP